MTHRRSRSGLLSRVAIRKPAMRHGALFYAVTRFGAAGRSLLELADACDVPTRWACRSGVCHTCVTPLLSGDVSYSPDQLEPPADGEVLICCAQPNADVVLDM